MIEELHVDLLVVDPRESADVMNAIAGHDDLSQWLQPIFDAEGYVIYRVGILSAMRGTSRTTPGT